MMEDLQVLAYVIISILYGISTITILMRIYVRGFTMRSFWWDDWLMTAMLVSMRECHTCMMPTTVVSN